MILFDQFSTENSVAIYVNAPQEIIAYGLVAGDKITVEIALLGSMLPQFVVFGCSLVDNSTQAMPIAAVAPYVVCGCPVQANVTSPRIVIERPGAYIITFTGPSFGDAVVMAEPATAEAVDEFEAACTSLCICEDTTWTPTGETRCFAGNVEQQEKSNCDNIRWTVIGPQTWVATGDVRCVSGNVEQKETNDCGEIRWTVSGPQTWVPTGVTNCGLLNVNIQEVNDCGTLRWVSGPVVTWTATGETRCENHLVERKEVNDCGTIRWTATTTVCGYCPSLPLSCDGMNSGYGYHIDDPKDPAATVEMAPCPGDTSVDAIWIYPSAGTGHTVKALNCDGTLIGYAANNQCAVCC